MMTEQEVKRLIEEALREERKRIVEAMRDAMDSRQYKPTVRWINAFASRPDVSRETSESHQGVPAMVCGRNVDPQCFAACGAPGVTFYLHDGGVCCYCATHDYACGSPLTREEAMARSAE